MVVHVITNVHNEGLLMPYFLRHYASFADRIFVYDAGSDDGPREMVTGCPGAQLIDWECPDINELRYMELNNSAYVEHSQGVADWVMMVDADEFVYHPEILQRLEVYREGGFTIVVPTGYNMVSDHFPTTPGQIYEEIRMGNPHPPESKPCVFRPDLTMNFGAGKHHASPEPTERASYAPAELKMLHQVYLGLQYRQDRIAARGRRMSQTNIDREWGLYCLEPPEVAAELFRIACEEAVQVVEP